MDQSFVNQEPVPVEDRRPQFLKILCILSFIACGLCIMIYTLGSMCLALSPETIDNFWEQVVKSNPQLEGENPVDFMHQVGTVSLYSLIANVFSLVGVILMWRLEKIGFFMYAVAELSVNFFSVDGGSAAERSVAGTIFFIAIDVAFIVMYAVNLKYMTKKTNNTFIQSGG
jgi:hypothetical protein